MTATIIMRILTEEHKQKISEAHIGKKLSEETKSKISLKAKGRKLSEKAKNNISKAKIGSKNPMWRGDDVGYQALHEWIKKRKQKPIKCEFCNERPVLDLANISQKYKRDLNDWEYLCRKCHMIKDGRMKNLEKGREVIRIKNIKNS